jgi:hypothetical protein
MKTTVLFAIIVALVLTLLPGCSGDTGPQGPAGPALTGSVNGRVIVLTANGTIDPDQSGVTVRIEGSPDSTLTDSLGHWTFTGISTGIYSIRAEKAGYGFTEYPQTQFVGGGDLYLQNKELVKDPSFTTTIQIFSWNVPSSTGAVAGGVSNTAASNRPVLVYIGRGPIDPLDPSTYINYVGGTCVAYSNVYNSVQIPLTGPPYNFAQGDTMYFAAYAQSATTSGYTDPQTGEAVISTGRSSIGGTAKWQRP